MSDYGGAGFGPSKKESSCGLRRAPGNVRPTCERTQETRGKPANEAGKGIRIVRRAWWKRIGVLVILAASAAGSGIRAATPSAPLVATVGKPAPAFVLEDLTGAPVSAKLLRGRPLFINVFATWCPPCRTELPSIVRSYDRFKGKVRFLGVDEQEPPGKIAPFTQAMGIRYPIAIDQGQMEASYRAHSVPTSVFIDRHGIVRALYRGAIPEIFCRSTCS